MSIFNPPSSEVFQYQRKCDLIVFGRDLNGLNLGNLRIKFSVKSTDSLVPNVADIRVYNLEEETARRIKKEFTRVILQAGYEGNYGTIFLGNIRQVIIGRESATDTFIDIVAGDGDRAYNFAIVNDTISPGATQLDQVNRVSTAMSSKGVKDGHLGEFPAEQLPRGKVMYGNAKNYLRSVANTTQKVVSIQQEMITFVPKKGYLPNEAIVLTSKTGMIGTPQQTNEGMNIKCLLNPNIRISNRVKIDNASVAEYKLNLEVPGSPSNLPAPIRDDGFYYVMTAQHQGDTRGVDWYTNILAISVDPLGNPNNAVQVSYGG